MPENQWKMEGNFEPWYFGWTVCEKTKSAILRQFYETPNFLPEGRINLSQIESTQQKHYTEAV